MKHSVPVTSLLVMLFLFTQVFGLWVLASGSSVFLDEAGAQTVTYDDTIVGARPEFSGAGSLLYVVFAIALGTGLVLLLMKFKKVNVWRTWFLLAVFFCCLISLAVILRPYTYLAVLIAGVLAIWKVYRPNVIVHNISEVLLYSGIAFLIAPMFPLFWAALLLVAISLYDMYAVWHSKHMIAMAKFQTESHVFAGLYIPYEHGAGKHKIHMEPPKGKMSSVAPKKGGVHNAILGGGDIAFPLVFNGAVFTWLISELNVLVPGAFAWTLLPVFGATIALSLLFFYSTKGKFYPAMPFISAGCFIGFGLLWVLV